MRAGEGLIAIADDLGVSPEALIEANDLPPDPTLEVGQVLLVPVSPAPPAAEAAGGTEAYIVAPGDSLSVLARRFGVSLDALARVNGLHDRSALEVGQRLRIPASITERAP